MINDTELNKMKVFMKKLEALSIEYNLWISSCGCCDGAFADRDDDTVGYSFKIKEKDYYRGQLENPYIIDISPTYKNANLGLQN